MTAKATKRRFNGSSLSGQISLNRTASIAPSSWVAPASASHFDQRASISPLRSVLKRHQLASDRAAQLGHRHLIVEDRAQMISARLDVFFEPVVERVRFTDAELE